MNSKDQTKISPKEKVLVEHLNHQKQFSDRPAERDKVLIQLIMGEIAARASLHRQESLLDIGCGNGNFLKHLRTESNALELCGTEVIPELVAVNQKNSDLAGISFKLADARNLTETFPDQKFTMVVFNCILGRFDADELDKCLKETSWLLKPDSTLFIFDWFQVFEQKLAIMEYTSDYPNGWSRYVRSFSDLKTRIERAGFKSAEFYPFNLPFDLPVPPDGAANITYTKKSEDGFRHQFRGAFYMPWCHAVIRR